MQAKLDEHLEEKAQELLREELEEKCNQASSLEDELTSLASVRDDVEGGLQLEGQILLHATHSQVAS